MGHDSLARCQEVVRLRKINHRARSAREQYPDGEYVDRVRTKTTTPFAGTWHATDQSNESRKSRGKIPLLYAEQRNDHQREMYRFMFLAFRLGIL